MPRSLKDSNLGTRDARLRLKPRGKPYWRLIEPGLHLGYRRLAGRPGTWCVRRYTGAQAYTVEAIKDQQHQIESLRDANADLREQVERLIGRLEAAEKALNAASK